MGVDYYSSNSFFKKNAFIYQFVYSTLFLKYFCWIDDQAIQSNINLQEILNIVKIEDTDCNSLTVEVGSNATDDEVKKPQEILKRKRK